MGRVSLAETEEPWYDTSIEAHWSLISEKGGCD